MSEAQQEPINTEFENKAETSPLRDFIEHQRRAAEETGKAFAALLPPEFRTHSHAAKEEFLASFKVLIDGVSEAVDREMKRTQSSSAGTGPSTTGKSKVKVEVS